MAGKPGKTRKLTSSMEDYLEAIAALKKEKGVARVRDISRALDVKKPSVTGALAVLSKKGLIVHERYGYVELTREGEEVARSIQRRHDLLVMFLNKVLGVDRKAAARDACRMEHAISRGTFERLAKFMEFVKIRPDGGRPEWLKKFHGFYKTGKIKK